MEIRWIKKDGEKVLQCRFVSTYHEEADKWVDVPIEEEEKSERKRVCDEIIEKINEFIVDAETPPKMTVWIAPLQVIIDEIKQIRDNK